MTANTMRENKMGTQPIPGLVLTMALPMMMSMLVQALYNVVDSIFVARISEDALTAVSLAYPMQNLMIGVGSGLGVGTNALLSRYLGQKRPEEASRMAMHGVFLVVMGGLMFFLLSFPLSRYFFVIQGAEGVIVDYGHSYLSIVMMGSVLLYSQMMSERLLQSTGKTVLSMYTQLLGALTNIILDPILIFGLFGAPKLGIAGAALATIIGQALGGCLGIYLNLNRNKELHFSLKGFVPSLKVIGQILYIGVPSIIVIGIGSFTTFSANKVLNRFTSTAVAVLGSLFKLQSICFMPVFALNNALVPITAFNYGAKNPQRMISCRRWAIIYGSTITATATALIHAFPELLLALFNASEDMLAIGVPAIRIVSISYILAAYSIVSGSFFQAVGNGIYSMLNSFMRQVLCLVPLIYLFASSGELLKVWWAWPLAEFVAFTGATFFMYRIRKQIIDPMMKEA